MTRCHMAVCSPELPPDIRLRAAGAVDAAAVSFWRGRVSSQSAEGGGTPGTELQFEGARRFLKAAE